MLDDDIAEVIASTQSQSGRRRTKEPVEVLDSDEELAKAAETQKEVEKKLSAVEYKINWRAFFETEVIGEDTEVSTVTGPRRFSFLHVTNAALKLAQMHASKNSLTVHHLKDVATLTWSGIKKDEKSVTALDGWQSYDTAMVPQLRIALIQKPIRKQPTVYIQLQYHRNSEGVIPESQRPPVPPVLPTMASLKVQKELDKQAREKTEQETREANAKDTLLRLIATWKCMEVRCPNYEGGQCYVQGNRHYKLSPRDLDRWYKLLVDGKHNPNVCPGHIRCELPSMRFKGTKNPLNGPADKAVPAVTDASKSAVAQLVDLQVLQVMKSMSAESNERPHRSSGSRRHKRRLRGSSLSYSGYSTPATPKHGHRYSIPSRRTYTPPSGLPRGPHTPTVLSSIARSRAFSTLPDAPAPRSSPVKPTGSANNQTDPYIGLQTAFWRLVCEVSQSLL